MGGGLLLLEIIKLIVNVIKPDSFQPDVLPFHYSDYAIFTLVGFAFSKKETMFNKLSFINFLMLGGIIFLSLMIAPNFVVDFDDLYTNFSYNTIHGFLTHYLVFYSFLWLFIWRVIKLKYEDIVQGLLSTSIFSLITMSFAFVFRANYNYCLASPFSGTPGDYHSNWNYVQPIYAFLIWLPLSITLTVGSLMLATLINRKLIWHINRN